MINIDDKVVLITGAASGIGRALALEMARRGANLVLADINMAGVEGVALEARRLGRMALALRCDVSDSLGINELATRALREMGRVDILVNNAGIGVGGSVHHIGDADWERVVDINLWAPIRLTLALLPHMLERKQGHIVNVASVAGLLGVSCMVPYSVTKFGVVGFSEALRGELADSGIEVSVVCPGYVSTNILRDARISHASGDQRVDMEALLPRWYRGLPPAKAAAEIVRGIGKKRAYIVIGNDARLLWWLKRLLPSQIIRFNRSLYRRYERGLAAHKPSPVPRREAGNDGASAELI